MQTGQMEGTEKRPGMVPLGLQGLRPRFLRDSKE